MYRSYLKDPIKAYPKFLVLISIALKYLGCSSGLVGNCKTIILCWGADFSVRRSILLYSFLMMFI